MQEEGHRGLYPQLEEKPGDSKREPPSPPTFPNMLEYFCKRVCEVVVRLVLTPVVTQLRQEYKYCVISQLSHGMVAITQCGGIVYQVRCWNQFYVYCQQFCCISAVQANLSVESSPGTGWGNLVYSTAAGNLPFSPLVMSEALKFLRLCLDCSAGVTREQRQRSQMLPAISVYLKELSTSTSGTNTH